MDKAIWPCSFIGWIRLAIECLFPVGAMLLFAGFFGGHPPALLYGAALMSGGALLNRVWKFERH